MVELRKFGNYTQYVLNSGELELSVTELGAAVTGLRFQGRETVMRCRTEEERLRDYVCTVVGRCANRISGARFSLAGREYILPANEGRNTLHGGPEAYDRRVWSSRILHDSAVRFELDSPDRDNGFPGHLRAAVIYSLEKNCLRISFEGLCDADTYFAPASHLYFAPEGTESCLDYRLRLNASRYVEVDGELLPTGRLLPAEGDFDFRSLRRIRRDYDHCFALDSREAGVLEAGGIRIGIRTDFPGLQIYTGSGLGEPFGKNGGLAVEAEFFPDSPNRPEFPSALLKKGELFKKYVEFCFERL